MKVGFDYSFEDAVVAYVARQWESATTQLGRTVMQKLCYFLKAKTIDTFLMLRALGVKLG